MGKSDRQVLVCIGDSWTDKNFKSSVYKDANTDWPKWPEHLAKHLDMEVLNLGNSGSGNQQIFNKAVDVINYGDNIGGVVCMWSEPDRIDFEIHKNKNLSGYNSVTDSGFFHWSPRRSLGNKRQTHMSLEQRYKTFLDKGIVQRQLHGATVDRMVTMIKHNRLQTKDILKNINEEIDTFKKQLEDIILEIKLNDNKQRSPTDFDYLADNTLKLGIWQIETSWNQSLRYWYAIQSICENEKIPYLQMVGTNPFFTWFEDQDYKIERRKVIDHLMTTDYMLSMNNETFVGWPIFNDLGGDTASSIIRDEKYRMGVSDSHPNESGHKYLAEYLYKEWNTKWA
tara:strand:- start:2951 stop:3967 length:1017 start_codon:yes stop_codon:yes gene_type:complete